MFRKQVCGHHDCGRNGHCFWPSFSNPLQKCVHIFVTSILSSDCKPYHRCGRRVILQFIGRFPLIYIDNGSLLEFLVFGRCVKAHWCILLCTRSCSCLHVLWLTDLIRGLCLLEIIAETVLTYSLLFYVVDYFYFLKTLLLLLLLLSLSSIYFSVICSAGLWQSIAVFHMCIYIAQFHENLLQTCWDVLMLVSVFASSFFFWGGGCKICDVRASFKRDSVWEFTGWFTLPCLYCLCQWTQTCI